MPDLNQQPTTNNQQPTTDTMMTNPTASVRFVDPGLCDRIGTLLQKVTLPQSLLTKLTTVTTLLKANSKSTTTKNKVREVLQQIEKHLLKKSTYNLVIRNIPTLANSSSEGGKLVVVTYASIRDTMNQFGKVSSLYMKYGVAYLEMTNNVYTHNTINNMQIGKNIIRTEVI